MYHFEPEQSTTNLLLLTFVQVGLSASVLGSCSDGGGAGEQEPLGREQEQIHLLPWEVCSCQPLLQSSTGQRDPVSETGPPQGKRTNQKWLEKHSTPLLLTLCNCVFVLQCPFHGRIIPRDEQGRPLNEEDRQREEQEARKKREEQSGEEWQTYTLTFAFSFKTCWMVSACSCILWFVELNLYCA